MERCKDALEREFYLRTAARNGWTKAVLQHQLDNKTYEKHLLSQSNFEQALPESLQAQAILAVKDHYSFEFLELAELHSERELERALVQNLRRFLTELGGDFAFVGSQYRLEVGGQEYFIDLLLFHRRLRCVVVVEYALRTAGRAIGVASYSVVPQLPEDYRDQLPSPEAIAARLENL